MSLKMKIWTPNIVFHMLVNIMGTTVHQVGTYIVSILGLESIRYYIITYFDEKSWSMGNYPLCLIFTILVLFSHDDALFVSKAKINVFEKKFEWSGQRSEEKISKNVDFNLWGNRATTQNNFFDVFKWDQIMKITHCAT